MNAYKLTTQAQQDLIQIRRFTLEHWGSTQSRHYLEKSNKTLQLLAEMPSLGRNCSEDLGQDIYRYLYGSHTIYYLAMPALVVIAVLHQSMIPGNHLANRL